MKKNKLLINVTTLMTLKSIMRSERSQTQISTYCMTPFIWHFGTCKITGTGKPLVVTRSWGWGRDGQQKGHKRTFGNVPFLDCGGGYLTICVHPILSNWVLLCINYTSINLTCKKSPEFFKNKRISPPYPQTGLFLDSRMQLLLTHEEESLVRKALLLTRDPSQSFASLTIAGFDTKHLAQSLWN